MSTELRPLNSPKKIDVQTLIDDILNLHFNDFDTEGREESDISNRLQDYYWYNLKLIDINKIPYLNNIEDAPYKIDLDKIEKFKEQIRKTKTYPPIVTDILLNIIDGWHRGYALKQLGIKKIWIYFPDKISYNNQEQDIRENQFYKNYQNILEEGLGSTLRKVGAGAALGLGSVFGANKYIDDESKIPPPPPAKISTDFPRKPLNIKDIDARARERIKAEQEAKAKENPSRIQKTRETLKDVDIILNQKIKTLIASIGHQETGHLPDAKRDKAVGDNGRAFGRYQIHKEAVVDVNRVYGTHYKHSDMFNRKNAEDVLMKYLTFWGKFNNKHHGVELTYRNLAAMWNGGGPSGWKSSNTEAHHYASDVINILKNKLASN